MRLIAVQNFIGSNWHRRSRKRPLVGPTGSPFLDTLVMQTRSCRWFRKNKSVNPLKRVTFRKYNRALRRIIPIIVRTCSGCEIAIGRWCDLEILNGLSRLLNFDWSLRFEIGAKSGNLIYILSRYG